MRAIGRLINPVKRSSPIKFKPINRSMAISPRRNFLVDSRVDASGSFDLFLSPPFDRLLPEAAGNLLGKQSFSPIPAASRAAAIRRFLAPLRLVKLGSVPARANQPVHPPSHGILIFRKVTAVPFFFLSPLLLQLASSALCFSTVFLARDFPSSFPILASSFDKCHDFCLHFYDISRAICFIISKEHDLRFNDQEISLART